MKLDRESRRLLNWGLLLAAPAFLMFSVVWPLLAGMGTTLQSAAPQLLTGVSCLVAPVGVILLLVAAADYVDQTGRTRTHWPNCRKCGYLLHGLSEPRCPECGLPFERPRD